MAERAAPARRRWSWRSGALRGIAYQIVAVALLGLALWYLAHNTLVNMQARGIQSGFGFLGQPAGFDIGESVIPYDALDPYWKAFLVGVLNTLRVSALGIVLATALGTLLGVARFSRNALVRGLSYGYIELFRNVPLLLQLVLWYIVFTEILPAVSEPIVLADMVFLSKGGLSLPWPVWGLGQGLALAGALVGVALAWGYRRWARRRFELSGQARSTVWLPLAIVLVAAVLGWLAGGAPTAWS
ncbi:MAG TPA: ABC transporter permease subunit, partial [Rubrivivax sp.]|nr:ABC transporter permease subunit [Rubrivivax sp.]